MQVGDVSGPLCDPTEHSSEHYTDVSNELGLGNDNDQLRVCHSLLWEWGMQHIHL